MAAANQRIVLLNTLLSRSTTRARNYDPPPHGALELLKILEKRRGKKHAIEFYDADDNKDDDLRIAAGHGHDFIRLRHIRFEEEEGAAFLYAVLLVEFVDWNKRSFSVVNTQTFTGREIEAENNERGGTTAHVVIRIPTEGEFQIGTYRCTIEVVHPITRSQIEHLLCRQLRREADTESWIFHVDVEKGKNKFSKDYRYTPRLELAADVGRKLNVATAGQRELSQMVFTKRRERHQTAAESAVIHREYVADVEYRVGASQGPPDPADRLTWAEKIKEDFRLRGFDTHLYYRNPQGNTISGEVHQAVAGAADLLMCPREEIDLSKPPKPWISTINSEVVEKMRELLDRDELWERSQ